MSMPPGYTSGPSGWMPDPAADGTAYIPKVVEPERVPVPTIHGVHGLVHVRDANGVSWWFNPNHVVATVLGRNQASFDWCMTIDLVNTVKIRIYDRNVERLLERFAYGDPIGDGR